VAYSVDSPTYLSRHFASMLAASPRDNQFQLRHVRLDRGDLGFLVTDTLTSFSLCLLFVDESQVQMVGDEARNAMAVGSFMPREDQRGDRHLLVLNIFAGFQHRLADFNGLRRLDYVRADVQCRLMSERALRDMSAIGNEIPEVPMNRRVHALVRGNPLALEQLVGSVRGAMSRFPGLLQDAVSLEAFGNGFFHAVRHLRGVHDDQRASAVAEQTLVVAEGGLRVPLSLSWHFGPFGGPFAPPAHLVDEGLLMLTLVCQDAQAPLLGQRELAGFFEDSEEARERELAIGEHNRYVCRF